MQMTTSRPRIARTADQMDAYDRAARRALGIRSAKQVKRADHRNERRHGKRVDIAAQLTD